MIFVDSSVWIDWFGDKLTIHTIALERLFYDREALIVGDLVVTEVLQGTRDERHFSRILARLREFPWIGVADRRVAVDAARRYRLLRARGITIRKTVDTLIATRCILDDVPLLYSDRDFDPFVEHCGLRSALPETGAT